MPKGHPLTPEQRDRIRALRAAGWTGARVAAALGLGRRAVYAAAPGVHARWLTPGQIAEIEALRADGHSQRHIARVTGHSLMTVRRHAPGWVGKVPVAPLREAFLASPVTAADVARELGWWIGDTGKADTGRVRRTLGLLPDVNGNGKRSRRTLVDAETVALIADAIGVSPWSVLPDDENA